MAASLEPPEQRASRRGRRRALILGIAAGVIVSAVAAGVVLAYRSTRDGPMTRAQYLAAANAICEEYAKRLDAIPPPNDPAAPGAVYESIGLALPVLRAQAAAVRALVPPRDLQPRVDRFFRLSSASFEHLARAGRQAGRRELFPMVQSLSAFERARE
ncbi:MAG: hypothetical protein QOJ43_421, partial [Gaiellaceae bacterium]|nr:hypothetical protein [Gaiellaceae bacterium]